MIRYPYQKPFACKSVPNPFRDSILVALEIAGFIVRMPKGMRRGDGSRLPGWNA